MPNVLKKLLFDSKWYTHITVEPSYALFYFIEHLCSFFHENLLLQKACRFNATEEPDLHTPCDDERRGIAYVAFTHSLLNLPNTPLMIVVATFVIAWSDKAGKRRKPIILLPLFGVIFEIFFAILHSYFWTWPLIAAVLTRNISRTFTGSIILFHSASSLFISDITKEKNRMSRIGVLALLPHFCIPMASLIAGYMLKNYGFLKSYSLCFGLSVLSVVLGVLLIKDISVPVKQPVKVCSLLNPIRMVKTIGVVFKKRPFHKRTILLSLVIAKVSNNFAITGEHSVFYLYLRHRFHWNEIQYSMLTAYRNIALIVGTFISLLFLSKWWKLHDGLIGAISGVWNTIAAVCYFLAYESWHLYVIPWLEMFHSVSKVSAKSLMTKMVEPDELGDLFSAMLIFNSVIPLNKLVYNLLFKENMDNLPNCFYLVSVALSVIGFIAYRYLKSSTTTTTTSTTTITTTIVSPDREIVSYKLSKKGYTSMG